MDYVKTLLDGYTVESGAIVADPEAVNELVVSHLDDDSGAFTAEINTAADAGEAADHLDEIADRAESLAETQDTLTAEVSAESLHREFGTVVRAYGFCAKAESFESAASDEARLRGIARDARRTADIARECRARTLDFSPEGRIMEFLRRDKSKLANANKGLDEAIHMLGPIAAKLKDGGVILRHDGFRRFLTVGGDQVADLDAALNKQHQYLQHAHEEAGKSLAIVLGLAKGLVGQGVKEGIHKALGGNHFGSLTSIATAKGGLLGNFSIEATDKVGKIGGLAVPVFKRVSEHSVSKKGLLKAAGTTGWAMLVGALHHGMMSAAIGKNGHPTAHRINNAMHTVSDVSAMKKGYDKYHEHVNASRMKSAATYDELVKAAESVRGYVRFTTDRLNLDEFESTLKAARANTGTLDSQEKSDLKAVVSALEDAAARIAGLESCVYEQAVYTTTMMASLIKSVVDRID